jgi:MoaA/NifB/PqqE/SkfB family radical SAM enzyme
MCGIFGDEPGKPERFHQGFMSLADWKRITDSLVGRPTAVGLCSMGEIFLNPQAVDMLRHAADSGLRLTGVNTNGMVFSPKVQEDLCAVQALRGKGFWVEFSIDGLKESCERQRRGVDYDRVVGNVDHFLELRRSGRHDFGVSVRMVVTNQTNEEIQEYVRIWADKGVNEIHYQNVTRQIGGACRYDLETIMHPELFPEDKAIPCEYLDYWLMVRSDLKAYSICCRDWFYSGGEAVESAADIERIWNSKRYRELGERARLNAAGPLCHDCDFKFLLASQRRISQERLHGRDFEVHDLFWSKNYFAVGS